MKIQIQQLLTNFSGGMCYVHARAAKAPNGLMRMTMQPLRLSGDDIFYGMQMTESTDDGAAWSPIRPCKNLVRQTADNGMERVLCDATPFYHVKTGTWLEIGAGVFYLNDEFPENPPRCALWTVYDEHAGEWSAPKKLETPGWEEYFRFFSCASGQFLELENGELLVPINYRLPNDPCFRSVVFRCRYDGASLTMVEMGNSLTIPVERGLYEPSLTAYQGKYYMCMRNDESGYVACSDDGLHYQGLKELTFEDGTNLGNYNTQQHWVKGGGKLYLVYTRKGLKNDHVFRHRAPLVMGQFDTETMCILRDTEQIVVPERGARLGNFGCTYVSEQESYVVVAEWMQPLGCEKYGCDNTIFVTKLSFDEGV